MDEMESTPQISETQSQSVDGTEDVTQEYMVPEQLERERLRTEIKRMKHAKLLDDHNKKKHINSLPFETIDDYEEEFSTKLSLQKFINVCKNLTPNQISLVKDIGFGNLLDLCCTELPRTLVRWLVRYFQSSTNTFNLPGGFSFILNSFTVHRILGIPIGGRNIPKKCSQSLRQQLKIETKCAGQTPSIKEMIDLLTPPQDEGTPELLGDQFKRIFVMFATAVFLCPTTYECVSPDYLAALEGPTTDISTYDWSGATLEKLVSSIKTYKQKEFTGALCGCLIIPVITYFEYLNIEVENNLLTRSNMPARLQIWNTDIVKKYAQLDRLSMEGNFGRHSLKDIRCTPFHPSSTSEPKVFHMSSRMEAYLECFVPENKLSDAKQQVASIVKHMYTNIFSVIQPVIEDNVEKLISIGRDLAGNKVKRSDQGLNCNLTEQVCNTKENISTNPSSSIDSRKGCSASQHSQSQSQAEISCSQKQSFAVPHSGITNFLNTLSSGENSDSHPTIKTNNSADCQKSTCATVDVIKQDGETRCDKQPEKAQEDNTIHEKDVDAADNAYVNSASDTKKDVAAQHGTTSARSPFCPLPEGDKCNKKEEEKRKQSSSTIPRSSMDKTRVVTVNEKSATTFEKQPEEGEPQISPLLFTPADDCNRDGSKNISAKTSITKDAGIVLAGTKRTTEKQMYEHSNKRIKIPGPSIQGATNHPVHTQNYNPLTDNGFYNDDELWSHFFDNFEQSQTATESSAKIHNGSIASRTFPTHTQTTPPYHQGVGAYEAQMQQKQKELIRQEQILSSKPQLMLHKITSANHTHQAECSAKIHNGSKASHTFQTTTQTTPPYHQGVGAYEAQMQQKQQELIRQEKNLSSRNEGQQRYSDDDDRYSGPGFRQMQLPYEHYSVPDENYSDPIFQQMQPPPEEFPLNENHSDVHEHYSGPIFQQMQPPPEEFPEVKPTTPFEESVYKAVIDNIPSENHGKSFRIVSIDPRWVDHRTFGLSMKVYGYVNSSTIDVYSAMLLSEQFHKDRTEGDLRKHIMYTRSTDLFADPGQDIITLQHQINEAYLGYRIPRVCHFVLIPIRRKDHYVYLIVVNFLKGCFEVLCPFTDCDSVSEHAAIVIANFRKAYRKAYNTFPYNLNHYPVETYCVSDSERKDDSGIYVMAMMEHIGSEKSFFFKSNKVVLLREQITSRLMTTTYNTAIILGELNRVFRQYNYIRRRPPNRR